MEIGSNVAIVTKYSVTYFAVAKSDKRGKVTLEDGSEWNARNGRRWGDSNPTGHSYYSSTAPRITTVEEGARTEAYRAEKRARELRHIAYKDGVARITAALQTYYVNDVDEVKAKIAVARAELDKLEKEFA